MKLRTVPCTCLSWLLLGAISALGQAPQSRIVSVQTTMVQDLTGPNAPGDQRSVDVRGNDLGIVAESCDQLFFVFGDTFGYDSSGSLAPGGSNWRSNTFGRSTDLDPSKGITIEHWYLGPDGKAAAIVEGAHQPPLTGTDGEQTKIPTSMIVVGKKIYVHYMSVHGFLPQPGAWETNYTKWVYSEDWGNSWTQDPQIFSGRDSIFTELALNKERGTGNEDGRFVYVLGTPNGRFGPARCARVAKEHLLDFDAWQFYAGDHWSHSMADAVEVVPAPVGEASLLWNPSLHCWMYTYLNESSHNLELRTADFVWGPWSTPVTLATPQAYPQLYGAFMTPSFLRDDGHTLYFVMSTFNPYLTHIMKAVLVTQ
ncbi:MAG: DUF4185 domain-containing protein [Verrucomicrobia bacterium]|nr:DUF4185 domain-containing protein [Verrucomicrobiota bacterium]